MGNYASCSASPDTHPEDYGDPANSLHILEADNGKSTPKGNKMENGALCAVFDEHGMNAHIVSSVVRNKLPTVIQNHMESMEYGQACVSAFEAINNELQLLEDFDFSSSGSTAVVVIQQGKELVIANLGDARAVLGTLTEDGVIKAIQLTVDQKPGVSDEAERIQNSGGRIFAHDREPHIQRVWLPDVDFPGLAMTRAFGNFGMKSHGIIATPVVTHHSITSNDQFLVLASDRVWDVLSNDEVVSIVSSANSEKKAAAAVANEALVEWYRKLPNALVNDTTVVCLFLQEREENLLPVTTN